MLFQPDLPDFLSTNYLNFIRCPVFLPDLPDFGFSLQILYQLFTIHSTNIYFVSTRLSWFYQISCIYLIILIHPDFFNFKFVQLQIFQIQISSYSDVQNSITPNSTSTSKLNFKYNYNLQLQTTTSNLKLNF